ncbi:MAG: hypothetical protein RL145_758 [Pseudomonadota bacterium]
MEKPPLEFDLIAQIWEPLTRGAAGAFGLKDDVAQLPTSIVGPVVTCDQVIEGTHFLPTDGLDWVAKRLVRRNVSDLIAKGCQTIGAFLTLAWPKGRSQAQLAAFATGLGDDLVALCGSCPLLGGDTSSIHGPLVASLTLIGAPLAPSGLPILRRGTRAGDLIFLTGTIGDPYLGLQVRLGHLGSQGLENAIKIALAPAPPPLATAKLIASYAHASIDISDGLLADAGHIADASGLSLVLDLDQVPISAEATTWLAQYGDRLEGLLRLVTGGDDYQSLICVGPEQAEALVRDYQALGVALTQIGVCQTGSGLSLRYQGQNVPVPSRRGWQFSDA